MEYDSKNFQASNVKECLFSKFSEMKASRFFHAINPVANRKFICDMILRYDLREFDVFVREFDVFVREFNVFVREFGVFVREFDVFVRKFDVFVREFDVFVREFDLFVRARNASCKHLKLCVRRWF